MLVMSQGAGCSSGEGAAWGGGGGAVDKPERESKREKHAMTF